jgi:hypothetical protein
VLILRGFRVLKSGDAASLGLSVLLSGAAAGCQEWVWLNRRGCHSGQLALP